MLEFIPNWLAVIFLLIGITGLLGFTFSKKIAKMLPLGLNLNMVLFIMVLLGFLAGGLPLLMGFLGGLGQTATATISGDSAEVPMLETTIECDYLSADGLAGNTTIRTDPNNPDNVFIDVDGTEYDIWHASAGNDLDVNFTCWRSGDVSKAGAVQVVVKGAEFRSETDTTDSNTYNILETSAVRSSTWDGKWKQTIYVDDDADADTGDTQEYGYIEFAEGSVTSLVSIFGEIDEVSLREMNNETAMPVIVYQRINGQDTEIGRATIQKNP